VRPSAQDGEYDQRAGAQREDPATYPEGGCDGQAGDSDDQRDRRAGDDGNDAGTDDREGLTHQRGSPSTVRQAATCAAFLVKSSRASAITRLTLRSATYPGSLSGRSAISSRRR
jgi:hypothetical protein